LRLVAGGWFVLREKYCWLVADKPSEQAWIPSCAMCRGLVGLNPIVYYLSDVDSDLLITVPIKIGLFFKEADSDLLITVPIKIGLFFKEAEEHGGGKS
jgi:hypothetical protein